MIYNSATNVFSESAARFVQDQLKQAGIEVELNAYANQADYQAAMDKREWDLNLGVQSLFVNHPLYELKMFLTGTSSLNIRVQQQALRRPGRQGAGLESRPRSSTRRGVRNRDQRRCAADPDHELPLHRRPRQERAGSSFLPL